MIVNIRESKARLSELVTKAAAGEEVLITVRGRPKARLVAVSARLEPPDLVRWAGELDERLARQDGSARADSSTGILDELRADRF